MSASEQGLQKHENNYNNDKSKQHSGKNNKRLRVLVVVLLLCLSCDVSALITDTSKLPVGVQLKDGQRFDYIVVGAGAAGTATASRLALAGAHVLLVEAGGDPNMISKIPSAAMGLVGSELDWQYETVPNNKSCLSARGQQCRFSRGKCLGGSTSINYMLYTRGNPRDFDNIPVPGWTWDDLFPYFLKYEGLQDLDLLPFSSIRYHNTTGTVRVGLFDSPENPWHTKLLNSFQYLGFPYNPDVNAQSQIGISQVVGYVYDGERMSTGRAYLERRDVKRRLNVAKNTLCTGVIIDKKKLARGITVTQGHKNMSIFARKEVILSAGAIGTPQILLLSGVGSADHLRSMKIKVKVELPGVGANMTDHISPLLIALVDGGLRIQQNLMTLASRTGQVTQLLTSQSGALTSNGLTDMSAFANSHCYDFEEHRLGNESSDGSDCQLPNVQFIHAYIDRDLLTLARGLFQNGVNLNDDVVDQLSKANSQHDLIVMTPVLLRPHSVGHVRLATSDPYDKPEIFPNYLDDDRDVEEMLQFIRIIEDLMETKSFKEKKAKLLRLKFPGCPDDDTSSDEYWRCYTRHMTQAVYHATGTCALGSVVDEQLNVYGVRRLRVADLSVLKDVPRGNTAAVSIAIGERLADIILKGINDLNHHSGQI